MNREKANVLGCYIDVIDKKGAITRISEFIAARKPAHIITLNAEIAYAARNNSPLKAVINQADLVTPDGIGIVWAARRLGWPIKERVTGIDMVYELCANAQAREWKIFLLGAAPQVAETAAEKLLLSYPNLKIAGIRDGYFSESEVATVVKEIREAGPDILLVGLGAPKQEFFINQHKNELGVPVAVGVGGSFDVIAGIKKRAPDIMIKLNLEWLYRLGAEPSRLKRQMVLPKFVFTILTRGRKYV